MGDSTQKLNNSYVKGYYDRQVGMLDGTYTDSRWNSSLLRKFEYAQTERALNKALSGDQYKSVLEIGPGDGVWTNKILEHTNGSVYLVEQSSEMFAQVKEKLSKVENVEFENSDFMSSEAPKNRDLIVAVRCFEYFEDKAGALKKMFELLVPGGKLIIITKNSDLMTSSGVQKQTLHSDQLKKSEMKKLLKQEGFEVKSIYPAVFRWKIKYKIMRIIFDALHRVALLSNGWVRIPFVYKHATESFVYVSSKPKL